MKFPPNRFLASERGQGIALVLATMLLFVIHDVLSKHLTRHYPIFELLWVRYLVHVTFMLAMFATRMRLNLVRTRRPALQFVRALFLLASNFLFMAGLRYLPLADATAINFVTPLLLVAFSAPLLGEKVESRNWAAVCLGFCGVLVIVRPGGALLQPAVLLPLSSACCASLYQIITRKFRGSENPVTTHFITGLTGVTVTGLACWPSTLVTPTPLHALLMFCMGLVVGVGHYLLIEVFQRIGPAVAAPFTYTQFLWAMLFGLLFFGDVPDMGSLLGCLIIVASGIYLARSQSGK
ncbi:MAG: DMT family transporter [Candidatus Accumulibacter sp.]|jgi:drug/metabolite transporter (DMT)-like permease|nr:DMT family transporter [Accumulibacter sp.]